MKINKNSHEVPKSWLKTFGQSTDNKNIGILTPGYGLEKVSYGLNPKNISYKKLNRIPIQRLVSGDNIFTQCPYLIGGKVDLVHSFNMLPLNKNFIVSFETELPRFLGNQNKRHIEFGYEILRSDRCKGIYALSDAGKQFAIKRMRDKGFHDLVDKVGIYRGGINISNPHIFDRESGGPIKACFIGASLFHKGIEPVLDALIELRTGGVDVEITVIGRPFPSSYAFTGMTFDSNKLMTTLEREHWINYYPVLPNSDVIDILYKSDILLFPSFDESLGWVLVEAGLAGIPRISTNIYAVPELIAHKVDGWMIDLPLNEDLRWIGIQQQNALEEYEKAKCIIKKGIIDIMGNSSMSIDKLHNMGVSAKKNISELYGFKQAQSKLEQIYNNATR